MKYLTVFTAVAFILFHSCKKEDIEGTEVVRAVEVTANNNGEDWLGYSTAGQNVFVQDGRIDIPIDVANEAGFWRERLYFFKIPNEIGRYDLVETDVRTIDSLSGASYYTLQGDGDVGGDSYVTVKGIVENYVEITKIEGKELWGTFQVAFIKNPIFTPQDPAAPDTVIFTNGELHTIIIE